MVIGVAVFLNIFSAPVSSLVNSATMYMLGNEKDLYGRIRLGGTIGFGIAASIVGVLVKNHGLKMAFWIAAVFSFLDLSSVLFLDMEGKIMRNQKIWVFEI